MTARIDHIAGQTFHGRKGEVRNTFRYSVDYVLLDAEAALAGPDFADATNGYAAYIDVDSFIDHHLLVELGRNVDGYVDRRTFWGSKDPQRFRYHMFPTGKSHRDHFFTIDH